MSSGAKKRVGSFIGTGAAKKINLDFTPSYVKVSNIESLSSCEKYAESELAGKEGGIKEVTAGTKSNLNAAQGITLKNFGFEIGTDASCNESGKHHCYIAHE